METRKNVYLLRVQNDSELVFFLLCVCVFKCVFERMRVCICVFIWTSTQILENSWLSGMRNGSRLEKLFPTNEGSSVDMVATSAVMAAMAAVVLYLASGHHHPHHHQCLFLSFFFRN